MAAASAPTGGSRTPIVAGAAALVAVAWGAGLLGTRPGRRVLLGGVILVGVTLFAVPEAVRGVQSRFTGDTAETETRFSFFSLSATACLSSKSPADAQ